MDFSEFIKNALVTESAPNREIEIRIKQKAREMHCLLGMQTEVGELIDQYKKHIFYGAPLDLVNVYEELGDLFWYIAILCDQYKWKLEAILDTNIEKLRTRYPDKFNTHDAIHRFLKKERTVLEDSNLNK